MAVTNRGSRRVQQTYRIAFSHAAPVGDALEIVGAAARTVTVREIGFSKPSVAVTLSVIKRGTADTGTAAARTPVPLDSTSIPGSATIKAYTVVPGTIGAAYGTMDIIPVLATDFVVRRYGSDESMPIILRGAGETLALSTSGTANIAGYIEWTEEAST